MERPLVHAVDHTAERLLEDVTDTYRVEETAQTALAVRLGARICRAVLGRDWSVAPSPPPYRTDDLTGRLATFNDDVDLYARDPFFELDGLEVIAAACDRAAQRALGSSSALGWLGSYAATRLLEDAVLLGIKLALVEQALLPVDDLRP